MELLLAEDFHDFDQLVKVVGSFEESIYSKDHARHSAPCRPNIEGVMIQFVVNQKFWSFVVSRRHSHIVLLFRFVEVSETPVD